MIAPYTLAWIALALIAIGNGTLRQFVYGPYLSELAAHQVSTLTGMILTFVFVWLMHRAWPIDSSRTAWKIGLLWLVMTVLFEFGFGRFLAGHSWSRLLADYNLLQGRVWAVFLVWILVLPRIVHRVSKRKGVDSRI